MISTGFMPHGMCLLWNHEILLIKVLSDAAIFQSYVTIPLLLIALRKRLANVRFSWMLLVFGAFIVGCSVTHLGDILTIWWPKFYWADAFARAATALLSEATVILLVPFISDLSQSYHKAAAAIRDLDNTHVSSSLISISSQLDLLKQEWNSLSRQ